MCHYNLACLPDRKHLSLVIDNFQNHVLGGDVQAAFWACMCNKTGVAAPIPVGNRTAKALLNRLTLMFIETLGCYESDANAEIIQNEALLRGKLRYQCKGR